MVTARKNEVKGSWTAGNIGPKTSIMGIRSKRVSQGLKGKARLNSKTMISKKLSYAP